MAEEKSYGYVFDLTPYTRTLNDDRRVAWNGFDLKRRLVKVGIVSAVIALLVAVIFGAPFGAPFAFVTFLLIFPIPFALIEGRQTGDMKLRYWQALYDKRASNVGKFILCNRIIDPGERRSGVIRSASLPVRQETQDEIERLTAVFDDPSDA